MAKVNTTLLIMSFISGVFFLSYVILRIFLGSQGTCYDPILEQDFDTNKYMGRWYEMLREKDIWFQSGECGHVFYTLNPDNEQEINVANTEYLGPGKGKNGDGHSQALGMAKCSGWRKARCAVRFIFFQPWGDYRVLATDHETYSIVYSCTRLFMGVYNADLLWVLTRQPLERGTPEHNEMLKKVDAILDKKLPGYDKS